MGDEAKAVFMYGVEVDSSLVKKLKNEVNGDEYNECAEECFYVKIEELGLSAHDISLNGCQYHYHDFDIDEIRWIVCADYEFIDVFSPVPLNNLIKQLEPSPDSNIKIKNVLHFLEWPMSEPEWFVHGDYC